MVKSDIMSQQSISEIVAVQAILGVRIRESRKQKELKQYDLCQKIGLPKGTLSEVESGKRPLRLDRLVRIADELNVSVDYLLGRIENEDCLLGPKEFVPHDCY